MSANWLQVVQVFWPIVIFVLGGLYSVVKIRDLVSKLSDDNERLRDDIGDVKRDVENIQESMPSKNEKTAGEIEAIKSRVSVLESESRGQRVALQATLEGILSRVIRIEDLLFKRPSG